MVLLCVVLRLRIAVDFYFCMSSACAVAESDVILSRSGVAFVRWCELVIITKVGVPLVLVIIMRSGGVDFAVVFTEEQGTASSLRLTAQNPFVCIYICGISAIEQDACLSVPIPGGAGFRFTAMCVSAHMR